MKTIIENSLKYIKDFFKDDYSGHDYYHSLRVYNTAIKIEEVEEENNQAIDLTRVKLIALLHDVDDYKISPKTNKNLDNARSFLKDNNIANDEIEAIISDISNLSFSKGKSSDCLSIEGKIVQDADRLEALGAIGIARTFAYSGANNRAIYDPIDNKDSAIKHFYDKLLKLEDLMNTNYGKQLAKERTNFMKDFLNEFYKEWNIK
ncbi:MAG: HD domain-containing protein [Pleomorphochaeta sp.]